MTSRRLLRRPSPLRLTLLGAGAFLTACAGADSRAAKQAETSLVGASEPEIVTCLGVPNRTARYGTASVLSYDGTSTSSGGLSLTLPVIGGVNFSGGGYCHLAVRLDDDRVTAVRYTGETDAPFSPDAYCAPLVRGCLAHPPTGDEAARPQAPAGQS